MVMGWVRKFLSLKEKENSALSVDASVKGPSGSEHMMMRAYHGQFKGATAFFRNRNFINTALSVLLKKKSGNQIKLFVHASSVGAEPYSLAIWWREYFGDTGVELVIDATDISPSFLEVMRQAVYPVSVIECLNEREKKYFHAVAGGVQVSEEIRQMVNILAPASFTNYSYKQDYDAVFIMNALTYVDSSEQRESILNASKFSRVMLGLTAFHLPTIRNDIRDVGFIPYKDGLEEIHNAWGDRLFENYSEGVSPTWAVPYFSSDFIDFDYKLCSIFLRT